VKRSVIFILVVFISFSFGKMYSQSPDTEENSKIYHTLERMEIKSGIDPVYFPGIKNYEIQDIVRYSQILKDSLKNLNHKDAYDIDFILKDNIDWAKFFIDSSHYQKITKEENIYKNGLFNMFYKVNSSFYTLNTDNFFMKINPVINFNTGKDNKQGIYHYQNTRGIIISGLLDKKIYFYTSIYENQKSFLPHIERKIKRDFAVPGQGYYKKFKSAIFKNTPGYDFLNSQAYFGFNITKSLSARIGHGKYFIGNGIRSLFLSDYSNNYYYLKFDTRVWKLHYRNIFAELTTESREEIGKDTLLPKKYMAGHYLNYKISNNFQIGIFENVIFTRADHYEFQYLNPVILFRTVEQFIGSADNVIVGIDWKYNFLHRFSFYGQLLLDEFNFSLLKENKDWWGNKTGLQLGLKYIDVAGINHLDMQIESNVVRPYTYSHREKTNSYSNFNQALAHPFGANFKELIILFRYKPVNDIYIKAKALYAFKGEDKDGFSWGGNILTSNENRPLDDNGKLKEYGYFIGNGAKRNITQYSFDISYMFFHNYNLFGSVIYRKDISELPVSDINEFYINAGIRINVDNKYLDF